MTETSPVRMTRDLRVSLPEPFLVSGITVRRLTPQDAPRVHAVMEMAYENGFGRVTDFETWWATTRHDDEFDPDLCCVAVADGVMPVGFALVWNSAFVKDLVVRPDWQNRGVGSVLLSEVFSRLKERGFESVALKVALANNNARRFYKRMGFVADA